MLEKLPVCIEAVEMNAVSTVRVDTFAVIAPIEDVVI
jgi:hypothetical protein